MKRDLYEWLDLIGKNSKLLIIIILALIGTGTYTAWDLFENYVGVKKPVKTAPAPVIEKPTAIESITCPKVVCGCMEKIKEYHE